LMNEPMHVLEGTGVWKLILNPKFPTREGSHTDVKNFHMH
jgi:hypothetical protein